MLIKYRDDRYSMGHMALFYILYYLSLHAIPMPLVHGQIKFFINFRYLISYISHYSLGCMQKLQKFLYISYMYAKVLNTPLFLTY